MTQVSQPHPDWCHHRGDDHDFHCATIYEHIAVGGATIAVKLSSVGGAVPDVHLVRRHDDDYQTEIVTLPVFWATILADLEYHDLAAALRQADLIIESEKERRS